MGRMRTSQRLRAALATVLERVKDADERVVLTVDGEPLVAVIPVEDLELLEELEDVAAGAAVRQALADPTNAAGPLAWERVKSELRMIGGPAGGRAPFQ